MSTSDNCKDAASKSTDDLSDAIGYLRLLNIKDNKAVGNVCANCGKEGSEVTNTCNKCKSVMYCNAACKKRHRHKHKKACERRVAELHDEKLFKLPPPKEDCPICMIRLPSLVTGRTYKSCCGKVICCGCDYAVQTRAVKEEDDICPFCRTPPPSTHEEIIKRYKYHVEMNDASAICDLGFFYFEGRYGLPQNYAKALEFYQRAAQLGYAQSYFNIAQMYRQGTGVERDEKKAIYYWELAAMRGDITARNILGLVEAKAGNMRRALKHWMIAVRDGCSTSLECIKKMYGYGHAATKDDYAKALSLYQAYLDEVKSDQRNEAAAARSGSNSN